MSMFRPQIRGHARQTAVVAMAAATGCLASEPRDRFASVVDAYARTPFAEADAVYLDPARALGPPDGKTVALGLGASLTVRFPSGIPDGPGPDLRVVEIGPEGARARVAVTADGQSYVEYDEPAQSGGATVYDLDDLGLDVARSVRLRGMDNRGDTPDDDPGFDLDALEALH